MKPKVFMVLFLIFSGWMPLAQAEAVGENEPGGLSQYYAEVLAYYPALKSQHANIEAAFAEKLAAYGLLLPSVSGAVQVDVTDDPAAVFSHKLKQEAFTAGDFAVDSLNSPRHRTNWHWTLEAQMPLFNGFQTITAIQSSALLAKSVQLQEKLTRQEAFLLALEAYLNSAISKTVLQSAKAITTDAEQDLKQADELKAKGMILGADFYAAKVLNAALLQQMHRLETAQDMSVIAANLLRGMMPQLPFEPSVIFKEQIFDSTDLNAWLGEAYANRLDLKAIEAAIDARRKEVFRAKTSALPKIKGFGAVSEDTRDWRTGGENFMLGVKGEMPIFDPAYAARVRKAKAELKKLEAERWALKDRITQKVSQTHLTRQALAKDYQVVLQAFEDAKEAVRLTESLYREGRKSIVDVMEMRQALLASEMRARELGMQAELYLVNLQFFSGTLDEEAIQNTIHRIDGLS
ncbi:MAG: hypothetical protein COV74_00955 [Candidatus Omnitrophica bacterium CG11_big_fil_rev_8_21_14_0_20_45_26]|uniref:Transporter n=1 Tax=Candidatus Abzuiibacterium crystallinum TaxID=1974748 RepID=A0A2H0LSG5_9BACT|nr:MAG: hypothetical protein COV74_00955 [Candidatus Omnitrophica bacterium CG11_big_fil_rev_8_21_14_0_20_45_26]PIW63402.1 MAG: hypothetical protein COW12_10480 [Candidatus Omnitrophica bacterium CG12_big_fil_rev_8_21_14_0_65_45_16]